MAVILIDIDHFKLFNDNYGHLQGDVCLKSVARALCSVFNEPGDEIVVRFGGEEFLVFLPGVNETAASGIAELRISSEVTPDMLIQAADMRSTGPGPRAVSGPVIAKRQRSPR